MQVFTPSYVPVLRTLTTVEISDDRKAFQTVSLLCQTCWSIKSKIYQIPVIYQLLLKFSPAIDWRLIWNTFLPVVSELMFYIESNGSKSSLFLFKIYIHCIRVVRFLLSFWNQWEISGLFNIFSYHYIYLFTLQGTFAFQSLICLLILCLSSFFLPYCYFLMLFSG